MCQYCNNTGLCYVLLTLIGYKTYRVIKPWLIVRLFDPIRTLLRTGILHPKTHGRRLYG
jgi:hypothetical protein